MGKRAIAGGGPKGRFMTNADCDRPADPVRVAQAHARPALPKRFYDQAEPGEATAEGHALLLDGKPARTPAKRPLILPTRSFADAVCREWSAQDKVIDPSRMPLTRLANSAIDGVATRMEDVRADIVRYCASDLVFYRAAEPADLVARQVAAWDPLVTWARDRHGAAFVLAQGVVHHSQSGSSLTRIAQAVDVFDRPFPLAGLHLATTLTGSALIALALADGFADADTAWEAAHVDEDWNIARWGADHEATVRRQARRRDFDAAVLALAVSGQVKD